MTIVGTYNYNLCLYVNFMTMNISGLFQFCFKVFEKFLLSLYANEAKYQRDG